MQILLYLMTIPIKAKIQGHNTHSATRIWEALMGKLGMGVGLTVTCSIHSLIHSNIEFKTCVFFLPLIGTTRWQCWLSLGAHRDTPRFPTLRNPQLMQDADANAKYCLWDRGGIVDATDPSGALEWLLF